MSQHHQTEAACLLQSGAIYHHRIGLQPGDGEGDFVFAGFKQGAFSLYFGDAPIFHFDLEGRWQRAYVRDRHYLKRLDASIHEINRVREGANLVLKRRVLDDAEAQGLDSEIREVAEILRAGLDAQAFRVENPPGEKAKVIDDAALREFLDRIAAWDASAWSAHRKLYHDSYGPLPFTPPDCQNAVILQATRGDAGGRSFGGGPIHDHGVRTPEEFERHVRDVASLLGRRLLQTRAVFLAGADVLRRPADDVLGYLDAIGRVLPLSANARTTRSDDPESSPMIDDVHVFLDDFSRPIAGVDLLAGAHKRRLSHIALGVESGDPDVRRLYGKDWLDEDLQNFVSRAKESDVELSVLTLVGGGGNERAADHIARTARLIKSLALTRGDLVFLLDEREIADSSNPGLTPLDQSAWAEQLDLLRQSLSSLRERGVKVLPYSMAKQWA
ncbi:hypothetical protein [Paludisphaera borealis]|uniref:Uncharacterized protein n=1 Tax=Paludisphaera borealis TaxID=1387353 RepID=A0A1U7CWB8_9BACT|nr:hypothetical protein [Paludisphaera borealis]APW63188.1 hypothetical protein BSF38_04751 [Paludisphaera borealis]